jgi:hypothetical protein
MTLTAHGLRSIAAAAAVLVAGCGASAGGATSDVTPTATHTTAATSAVSATVRRAQAGAVDVLARALRDGDVERLCRPGAVFSSAVVAEMNSALQSCEQEVELSSNLTRSPILTVVQPSTYEPDLATLRVHVAGGGTIPIDVIREQGRWLVSFSDGNDPLTALAAA